MFMVAVWWITPNKHLNVNKQLSQKDESLLFFFLEFFHKLKFVLKTILNVIVHNTKYF